MSEGVVVEKMITTDEGLKLIRRVRRIRMPNGKYRYPVDYYDATSGAVEVSEEEHERMRIPFYEQLI